MYKDIKQKIKRQRTHLVSVSNQLSKQIELKNEIIDFVRHSEKKLNRALQQENMPHDMIDKLTAKLADDQRLYTECKILIYAFQADIKATKKGIEKSKLTLHHIIFPQKTCSFFKQKNDNGQASSLSHQSAHIVHFKDKLFKAA